MRILNIKYCSALLGFNNIWIYKGCGTLDVLLFYGGIQEVAVQVLDSASYKLYQYDVVQPKTSHYICTI